MGWQECPENDDNFLPLTEDELREFQTKTEQVTAAENDPYLFFFISKEINHRDTSLSVGLVPHSFPAPQTSRAVLFLRTERLSNVAVLFFYV